jgi:putative DNA primase/helicase
MSAEELHDAINGAAEAPVDWPIEIARLAALPGILYDREREDAAARLGCRVGTLDKEVGKARGEAAPADDGQPGAGRPLRFEAPEPHPEPVDGSELLTEIAATVRRFVAVPKHADTAIALWVLHTHAFEASPITPRLAITSPEKRCGKTTLLELVGALAPKPQMASNVSAAAVFRTIELCRPTLLVDEADTFLGENEELRGVLNSGHRRSGEVIRVREGRDGALEPVAFSTWAPVAIAMIGKLPGTLEDRAIRIAMRRRAAGEVVERWRCDRLERFAPLVRKAARWAADHGGRLAEVEPEVPSALHDRAADNWRPLLAIADAAGGEWPKLARAAALALSGGEDADSYATMVLEDVRALFAEQGDPDALGSKLIVEHLAKMEHRPWPEISSGKPITTHKLARLLGRFEITPKHEEAGNVYRRERFVEAWSRYLSVDTGHQTFSPSGIQQTCGSKPAPNLQPNGAAKTAPEGLGKARKPRESSLPEGLKVSSPGTNHDDMEEVRL